MPSTIRTFALREMKRILGEDNVYRFIVGKFGEITILGRHYLDLLEEADLKYLDYTKYIIDTYFKPPYTSH